MAELMIRTTRYATKVAAPPKRVYELIAQAGRWPQIFGKSVAVEPLGFDGTSERLRTWELSAGEVYTGVLRRELVPGRMQVRFRQESCQPPLATLGGLWLVLPKGNGSLVTLDHYYRVLDDDPSEASWLASLIEQDSTTMLAELREIAELGSELDDLLLSFSDSVDIDGDTRDVYDFLARAQDWPCRLPHVARLRMDEWVPDVQLTEMDTRLRDNTVETTCSVRICFPDSHIVYKKTTVPPIMRAHTGSWVVSRCLGGVRATATHLVLLRKPAIIELLGPGSTVDHARQMVHDTLSGLSRTTLARAKEFAEARRPAVRAA